MQDNLLERKDAHLALCLNAEMRGPGADLSNVHLPYEADFPVDPKMLNTHVTITGRPLVFPLIIGCMTGGTPNAQAFNNCIRKIGIEYGIGVGLGSMRAVLEDPSLLDTYGWGSAPWLFGNLGISEVMRGMYSPKQVRAALENLGCHGLYIHLNAIQEWVQPDGDHSVWTDLTKLGSFINELGLPVIVKEVGNGLGGRCAERLGSLNLAGLETASRGGTSWIKIESARRANPLSDANLRALDAIGYTLRESIASCRRAMGQRTVIASGGIEDALTLVKCLALGADAVSIAQPVYAAFANNGYEGVQAFIEELIDVSKIIWRSTGAHDLNSLRARCLCDLNPFLLPTRS